MATKTVTIEKIGEISLQKRRGSKSIRLKVGANGRIVVTLPYFVPYAVAMKFVHQHTDWLQQNVTSKQTVLPDGMAVGRAHRLRYIDDSTALKPRTRVTAGEVIVRHMPGQMQTTSTQNAAKDAAIRALKKEALTFLPRRLAIVAAREGYEYKGVVIKRMRSRWGSCNQDKRITLNIFLMQLPIELIDYVILHELAHTRALNHSPAFWSEFESHLPNAKKLRREIHKYQPILG